QSDLTIISSAHWPARFQYKNHWQIAADDWSSNGAFLARIPLPEGAAVALVTVRQVSLGERRILLVAGKRLDSAFLASLGAAPGMRTLLWLSPTEVFDVNGSVRNAEKLAPLADQIRNSNKQASATLQWTEDRASAEAISGFPLERRGTVLGVLFVAA